MITAIYARKSTEQTGVADDKKSVARQVEHARLYACSMMGGTSRRNRSVGLRSRGALIARK
jgi:hypothetical protein